MNKPQSLHAFSSDHCLKELREAVDDLADIEKNNYHYTDVLSALRTITYGDFHRLAPKDQHNLLDIVLRKLGRIPEKYGEWYLSRLGPTDSIRAKEIIQHGFYAPVSPALAEITTRIIKWLYFWMAATALRPDLVQKVAKTWHRFEAHNLHWNDGKAFSRLLKHRQEVTHIIGGGMGNFPTRCKGMAQELVRALKQIEQQILNSRKISDIMVSAAFLGKFGRLFNRPNTLKLSRVSANILDSLRHFPDRLKPKNLDQNILKLLAFIYEDRYQQKLKQKKQEKKSPPASSDDS